VDFACLAHFADEGEASHISCPNPATRQLVLGSAVPRHS
jgi:hypothetical protein